MKILQMVHRPTISLMIIAYLIVGCQGNVVPYSNSTLIVETFQGSKEISPSPTKLTMTVTLNPTPTPTLTPRPTRTLTPLPPTATVLPTTTAQAFILDLLENNADCKFPCWWGIIPGKTTWLETQRFMTSIVIEEGKFFDIDSFSSWWEARIQVSEIYKSVGMGYTVRGGVVEMIEIHYTNLPIHKLSPFLSEYGKPGEIWIETFGEVYEGHLPFYTLLFYPNQGILAHIETDASINGDYVRECYYQAAILEFAFWKPNIYNTFPELSKFTHLSGLILESTMPYYLLEDVTDMDIKSFYETFKNNSPSQCLETPTSLWPRRMVTLNF